MPPGLATPRPRPTSALRAWRKGGHAYKQGWHTGPVRAGRRSGILPIGALVLVAAIVAGALSLLFLSRNQGQTAQTIEAAVALLGAAAAAVNWILQKLKRKALEPAVRSVIGLSAAVPTGDLPNVIRGREQVMERLRRLFRKPAMALPC